MKKRRMRPFQVRFFDKIQMTETCWNWTAGLNSYGYGQIRVEGKSFKAHRIAYLLWVGEIPEGLTIDHLCRNRRCVNPAHLEVVPGRINTLRGEGPTAQNARKESCAHGHPLMGDNLTITTGKRPGLRRCRACARISARRAYARARSL